MHVAGTRGHVRGVHNASTQEALALEQEARLFPQ